METDRSAPDEGDTFLAVYGHTAIDHIAWLSEGIPSSGAVAEVPYESFLGGNAANIAAMAASLGVPVALASLVGEDFPAEHVEHLRSLGVETGELVRSADYSTPECYIMTGSDNRQEGFLTRGCPVPVDESGMQFATLQSSRHIHITTGHPSYHIRIARRARELGRVVAFDPGQGLSCRWDGEGFLEMSGLVELLFLSEGEATLAMEYASVDSPQGLVDLVPTVIITKGIKGAVMLSPDGLIEVPAIEPSRIVDLTGAGDAFRGGYYAGLWRGLPPRERLLLGSAAASFVVEGRGAQANLPTFEEAAMRAGLEIHVPEGWGPNG
jgi:sugar/nucleoside kinase (ribokinase family)